LRSFQFDSAAGPWRLWTWVPAADLQPAVAALWATQSQTRAFREKVLPRETVELMINFGGAQKVHRRPLTLDFHRYWVSGLQTGCLEIESPTAPQLIAASLHPACAGPLLGIAGREIAGRVVPLDEVISHQADALASRLEESPSVTGRFLLFEDFLRHRLRTSRRPAHPAVCRAWRRLISSGGREPVRQLSAELGCSPRYLELRVGEEIGMTPKKLARLVRFNRVIDRVRTSTSLDWARVAQDCGYYDQAHFNRDFLVHAGVTPTEFLASRDPSSQAMLIE
jgi:AraC-like DNA-binding protein